MVTSGIVGAPTAAPPRDPAGSPPATPAPGESPPAAASRNDAVQALDNLHFALRDYRAALGGNPVGTNQEITAALLGDNLKQVRLDLPEGSRANGKGEMCDPWGTPYFFHQVSAEKMEIRSAGPDRVMWTGDDVEM